MTRIKLPPIAQQPDLTQLPIRVDRAIGAALVSRFFFPVTQRTIEAWPAAWVILNGKAVTSTEELFQIAQAKLDTAQPARVQYQGNASRAAARRNGSRQ